MVTLKRLTPLLLVAMALRLPGMFTSLWYDEAFTLYLAKLPVPQMIAATAGDVHPPLWYLIARLSCLVVGFNEWGVRLPSLIFGLALIPSVDILLDLLTVSARLKTVSLWIIATAPTLILYATEARMYSLLALIICWAAIFSLRGNWAGLTVCLTAGMYTQNMFALFIPVFILLSPSTSLIAGAFSLVFYSPWIPVVLKQFQAVHAGYWIQPLTIGRATSVLYRLLASAGHHEQVVFVTAPMVLLILAAGVWQLRQNRNLLALALLPFTLACLISLIQPILIERIFIGSVPALLVLLMAGALWLADRVKYKIETYPILLFWIIAVGAVILTPTSSDLRARYAALNIQPGDICYHLSSSTVVTVAYAIPNCVNYVWQSPQTILGDGLSGETKTAMGMRQLPIEAVPSSGALWLFHYTGPNLTGDEFTEQARILDKYPVLQKTQVQFDAFVAQTTVWRLGTYEYAGRN
jgi:hypothetical protein